MFPILKALFSFGCFQDCFSYRDSRDENIRPFGIVPQILKDLFIFFNLFPFFCSIGQFVLICLYWFILIYWTISLLNFFNHLYSVVEPIQTDFFTLVFFLFLKLQFGSFCIKCFSNETVHPSIHFEGFALTSWCTILKCLNSTASSQSCCLLLFVASLWKILRFS